MTRLAEPLDTGQLVFFYCEHEQQNQSENNDDVLHAPHLPPARNDAQGERTLTAYRWGSAIGGIRHVSIIYCESLSVNI